MGSLKSISAPPPASPYAPLPTNVTPEEKGLLQYHRMNLETGKYLDDEKGLSTVYMMGVGGPDGREYNIPGYADGKRLTLQEAVERADKIGWKNFPSYATVKEAEEAAHRLHRVIDEDEKVFRRLNPRKKK